MTVPVAPPGAQVPEPVVRYFECINAEDYDSLRELFHPDAEFVAVGARPRRGRDDVLTYFPAAFALLPTHDDQPTRYLVAGDTVVVEITFRGETPEGTRVEFDAVDVMDLRDGLLHRITSWYDTAAVRRQTLGTP
ncbi:MAG TPA: nuclear transport factor 2 family protein [Egibacteraceae bacterium]